MKTYQEILTYVHEAIKAQGGRAVDPNTGGCVLENEKGQRCGFSLCLSDEGREKIKEFVPSGYVGKISPDLVEESLLPEFQGHPKAFWIIVQKFHDDGYHFDPDNGYELTKGGVMFLDALETRMETIQTKLDDGIVFF